MLLSILKGVFFNYEGTIFWSDNTTLNVFGAKTYLTPTGIYEILLTTTCKHQAFEYWIVLHTCDYNYMNN